MARRIPLPRLTQQQRTTRWQRERRQQAILIVLFTTVLMSAVALVAWTAADRYYTQNLRTAATVGDTVIPWRDYQRELKFQLTKFYEDSGVPREFENDPQITRRRSQFESVALEGAIETLLLREQARANGISPTSQQIDERYAKDYGQFRTRHVLVAADTANTDTVAADKAALTKAEDIAKQLKAAPRDDALWKKLASESSTDPGSKDQGGELGWVSAGQFVREYEDAARAQQPFDVSAPVKSPFGYHVIQLEELRGPEFNPLVIRWQASGIDLGVIKDHARGAVIRDEMRKRAEERTIVSPAPQLRLAKIVVNTPQPTSQDFQSFTEALKKLSTVTTELEKPNADFGAIARQYSDDPSAQQGGDIGWVARGLLTDLRAESELFSLGEGKVATHSAKIAQTTIYKVVQRDESRAISEEQRTTIKGQAYSYWFEKLKLDRGVRKLVPGHELE